ncbi:MAG: hypothetical protein SFZ23_08755 [Planctomycetota bacterium]|nr:hypothetical protein [Planctomycetota bacterium]
MTDANSNSPDTPNIDAQPVQDAQPSAQTLLHNIQPSNRPVTCGRIVHVYCSAWEGPRPGITIRSEELNGWLVNVFTDTGSDISIVNVYEPFEPFARDSILAAEGWAEWAEWPPIK